MKTLNALGIREAGNSADACILRVAPTSPTEYSNHMSNNNSIGDLTLGLNSQALSVLQALAGMPLSKEDLHISTSALYNGREKGFCLEVTRDYRKALHIFVAECRSGDSIFVWSEEDHSTGLNPPTMQEFSEESYNNRVEFRYLDIGGVVENILGLLEAF